MRPDFKMKALLEKHVQITGDLCSLIETCQSKTFTEKTKLLGVATQHAKVLKETAS